MTAEQLDNLDHFGELREIVHRADRPHRRDSRRLSRLLLSAHRADPRAYREQWLPYLEHYGLRELEVRDIAQLEKLLEVAPEGCRFRLCAHQHSPGRRGLQAIACSPLSEHLTAIDLHSCSLRASALEQLLDSPYLGALEALDLGDNRFELDGVHLLAQTDALPNLRELSLWSNILDHRAVAALTDGDNLPQLRALDLGMRPHRFDRRNELGPQGAELLRQARWSLTHLAIAGAQIQDEGLLALRGAELFESLYTLDLELNQITGQALQTWIMGTLLPRLRSLNLSRNPLGERGAKALAHASPSLLQRLGLRCASINKYGLQLLENWRGRTPNLEILDVSGNCTERGKLNRCKVCQTEFLFSNAEIRHWATVIPPSPLQKLDRHYFHVERKRCDTCQRLHMAKKTTNALLHQDELAAYDHRHLVDCFEILGNARKADRHDKLADSAGPRSSTE